MFKYFSLLWLFAVCLLFSCNKKNEAPDPKPSTGKFEFKANGVQYKFNNMVGAYEDSLVSGVVLAISAAGNSGYQALGSIADFDTVGTNPVSSGFSLIFYINNTIYGIVPGSSLYTGSHGTIHVTELKTVDGTRYAKGTFSGVAYKDASDSLIITEGVFQDRHF